MSIAIKVENLSKIYRLGEIGTGTISRDLQRWYTTKVRGKEDPFLKIGQANDRTAKSSIDDIVYSLQDINFEIKQGDAVGIIGRNGAGKSTLLKILSRVTSPTTGKINIKGRVASLLEVGTGFHPELTGRENIYLNGAILGMRKKEINRKLDEIIDFSGVERYIDTPVKRYSSGMYVRLAFAVAAHLESEILIVDEVLAVGDAEFQKKCLGKMGDVSRGEGRTILFVSHNIAAVGNLCNQGIMLDRGSLKHYGIIADTISSYKQSQELNSSKQHHWNKTHQLSDIIDIHDIQLKRELATESLDTDTPFEITIKSVIKSNQINMLMDICLYDNDENLIFDVVSPPQTFTVGEVHFTCSIPRNILNCGKYRISVMPVTNHNNPLFKITDALIFTIEEGTRDIDYYGNWPGIIRPKFNWIINEK